MGIIFSGDHCRPVSLPECLSDWLDRHLSGLHGGMASVTVECCDEIRVGFLVQFKQTGYTSGKDTIHIAGCPDPIDPCDEEFVRRLVHELIHVLQWRRHPRSWRLRYLWRLLRARGKVDPDTGHKDERHAWEREHELWKAYASDNPCDCPW